MTNREQFGARCVGDSKEIIERINRNPKEILEKFFIRLTEWRKTIPPGEALNLYYFDGGLLPFYKPRGLDVAEEERIFSPYNVVLAAIAEAGSDETSFLAQTLTALQERILAKMYHCSFDSVKRHGVVEDILDTLKGQLLDTDFEDWLNLRRSILAKLEKLNVFSQKALTSLQRAFQPVGSDGFTNNLIQALLERLDEETRPLVEKGILVDECKGYYFLPPAENPRGALQKFWDQFRRSTPANKQMTAFQIETLDSQLSDPEEYQSRQMFEEYLVGLGDEERKRVLSLVGRRMLFSLIMEEKKVRRIYYSWETQPPYRKGFFEFEPVLYIDTLIPNIGGQRAEKYLVVNPIGPYFIPLPKVSSDSEKKEIKEKMRLVDAAMDLAATKVFGPNSYGIRPRWRKNGDWEGREWWELIISVSDYQGRIDAKRFREALDLLRIGDEILSKENASTILADYIARLEREERERLEAQERARREREEKLKQEAMKQLGI